MAEGDVASIINVDRRLNEGPLSDFAKDLLQHLLPVRDEGRRGGIFGKVVVVFVHELASTKASVHQFFCLAVVQYLDMI